MFLSISGTVTDDKQTSENAKWLRKKYMGEGIDARVQLDEQVPQHCGHVHSKKQGKKEALLLWLDGEPQKEERGQAALVFPPHSALPTAGGEVNKKYKRDRCETLVPGSTCISFKSTL
jgi:hypothetical protein